MDLSKMLSECGCELNSTLIEFKKLFGERIKHFRDVRNYTQEYLAELAGIEQASLSNIERGKVHPSLDTTYKIAAALGVQPYEFYKVQSIPAVQDIVKEISEAMYHDRKLAELIYKFFQTVK